MLIKTKDYEVQADSFKVKGKANIVVGQYKVKTSMPLTALEEGVAILVPNSTGRLFVRKGTEEKMFILRKNEPADLMVKGTELTLGSNEGDFNLSIDGDIELVFKSNPVRVDYNDPIVKKILKVASKKPVTRLGLFEAVLSKDEYHRFAYGSSKSRSLNYYGKYLWPLVDDGKLKIVDGLRRRYSNLFQAV
jgi:hypothetical protein